MVEPDFASRKFHTKGGEINSIYTDWEYLSTRCANLEGNVLRGSSRLGVPITLQKSLTHAPKLKVQAEIETVLFGRVYGG
jgi:hypothetical protein